MPASWLDHVTLLSKRLLGPALAQQRLEPEAGHAVLLTFDDGPHPEVTHAVLDRLRTYGARAVFFVIGQRVERAPEVLRRIVADGHLLGNHSHAHRRGGFFDLAQWRQDLHRTQVLVEQFTGVRPRMFRPPYGYLSPASLWAPWSLGLRTIGWSLDVEDWRCRTAESAAASATALVRQISAGDIVLLHDDNRFVLPILDQVLPDLAHFDLVSAVELWAGSWESNQKAKGDGSVDPSPLATLPKSA